MASFDDDLRLAHVLADSVERFTLDSFRAQDLDVQFKEDGTLVSRADTHTEELLRHQLGRTRPRDVVQGEELPTTGHGNRRWILDPIDGTVNYVRGVPVWATLIGLVVDDVPVVGLVAAPALNRRWWAATGSGSWTGRSLSRATRISVSDTSRIEHSSLSYADLNSWSDHPRREGFLRLAGRCWRTRAYGDFWSHVLVAEGAVDIGIEPALAVHDMAALAPILTEAGGRLSDLDGTDGPFGSSAVSSNGQLHDGILSLLNDGLVGPDDDGHGA
ncbi:inositol monophosphatase family protein [Ornithinimicrobium cryptoxanthini]|uniref:Histidinol phosphatase n=1 Tax=Ornithinimicrobium cryptoxanthini TaxID=2934161 RepID=A0ABY4YLL8_9MICO|nr:inositol monophosphatase family protein [Ornithinimicrobium cryptoxanthini]USQ77150.1 histidinol phosphatase [Ornithinimicrobium cryptoxanthini]